METKCETSTPPLTFDMLRCSNLLRTSQVFHSLESWSATDWACAMAGECGEACNIVKKIRRLENPIAQATKPDEYDAVLREGLASELADLVIYTDLLASRVGIELGEAVRRKFNRVSEERGSGVRL